MLPSVTTSPTGSRRTPVAIGWVGVEAKRFVEATSRMATVKRMSRCTKERACEHAHSCDSFREAPYSRDDRRFQEALLSHDDRRLQEALLSHDDHRFTGGTF